MGARAQKTHNRLRRFSAFLVLAGLAFALFLPAAPAQAAAENRLYYESLDVDAVVDNTRSITVTEKITIVYKQPMHGTYRRIPRKSAAEKYLIEDIRVQGAPFTEEWTTDEVIIKMGDPDQYVTGTKSYVLSYKLVQRADFNFKADYIYFTPIGTGFEVPIQSSTTNITFPSTNFTNFTVNVGEYGATGNNGQVTVTQNGNTMTLKTTQPLLAYEGITLEAEFPNGTFAFVLSLSEIIMLVLAVVALAATAALFTAFGRDKPPVETVEFYAPDQMNPAEVGYVIDNKVNAVDITSLIYYWASHGHLTLQFDEQKKSECTFIQNGELDSAHKPYEHILFNAMFALGSNGTVLLSQLRERFYAHVNTAKSGVRAAFTLSRALLSVKSVAMSVLGLSLNLISLCAMVLLGSQSAAKGFIVLLGVVALPGGLLWYCVRRVQENWRKQNKGSRTLGVLGCLVLGIAYYFAVSVMMMVLGLTYLPITFFVPMLGVIGITLSAFITKRTEFGQTMLGRVAGFRTFLLTAEKAKLETLLAQSPSYFYDILPYAHVLGVSDAWAKRFESITLSPPSWYMGSDMSAFSTIMMLNQLNRTMNTVTSGMTSMPANQGGGTGGFGGGFGGGGFSGGGSGGGGGGGW